MERSLDAIDDLTLEPVPVDAAAALDAMRIEEQTHPSIALARPAGPPMRMVVGRAIAHDRRRALPNAPRRHGLALAPHRRPATAGRLSCSALTRSRLGQRSAASSPPWPTQPPHMQRSAGF